MADLQHEISSKICFNVAVDFLLGNGQILFNITFEDDQQVLSVTLESMYQSTSIEFKKRK